MNGKFERILGGALAVVALIAVLAEARAQKFWKDIEIPSLREFQVPQPEIYTMKNGLRVFLLEDHSLPKVEAEVLVRTGSIWEPPDKIGLASILGQVLRTGGTRKRTGEQIDELIESLGAQVETSISKDSARASLFVLVEDLPVGIEVLADLIQDPALPEDKIELAKVQERDAIARRNDDVEEIASREISKLLFGTDSPYARHTEYATIDAIRRDDLVAFHKAAFWPDNTMLGLVGDFESKAVKELLEQHFGGWKRSKGRSSPEMPPVGPAPKRGVHLISKEDVNQTQLRLVHLGGRRDDPDYFALVVMTEIFGGGNFSARLLNEVRTERGLAYGAYGVWSAGWERPGAFIMESATKSATTVETARVMVQLLRELQQAEPAEAELTQAKESLLNSFVFNFETRGQIVSRLMEYAYHGYPLDFLQRFKRGVESVSAAEVLRVAKAHLRPDELVVLAVGKDSEFGEPLSALGWGEPMKIDIAIPTPAEAVPEADAESLRRGQEIWTEVRQAYGGTALGKVVSLRLTGSMSVQTPAGQMDAKCVQEVQLPDKLRLEMQLPMGTMEQGFDGKAAWIRGPMGTQELPPSDAQEVLQDLFLEPLNLLREAELTVQFLGEEAGAAPGWLIRVQDPDQPLQAATVKVAKDGARILEMRYRSSGPQGPSEVVDSFSDWKTVGGVLFAFREETTRGGKPFSSVRYESIEVNPELNADAFSLKK
jgi:zinc protease